MTNYTPAQRVGITAVPEDDPDYLFERSPVETTQMDLSGSEAVEGVYFEPNVQRGEGVDHSESEVLDRGWTLPGRGAAGERCGVVAPNGYCTDGHVTFGRHDCGRRSCPRCWYSGWRNPRTVDAVVRLAAKRHVSEGWDKRAVHVSLSPDDGAEISSEQEFYEARSEAVEVAREANIRGGLIVPHGYRVKDDVQEIIEKQREAGEFEGGDWKWVRESEAPWYESVEWFPHFHVIGLSADVEQGDEVRDGWLLKNIRRKRADGEVKHSLAPFYKNRDAGYEDMASVVGYLLSHATYVGGSSRQTMTWFGSLHSSQFNADPTDDEKTLDSPLTEPDYWNIRQTAQRVVGHHGDEYGEGSGDDEEERECPHEGCEAAWKPIHTAEAYLEDKGSKLSDEVYNRIQTAYLWSEGDLPPPPGLKRPTTAAEARDAFRELL